MGYLFLSIIKSLKIVSFVEPYVQDIVKIRTAVFVEGQKIDPELDFDGLDKYAVHALVYKDKIAVGTARMLEDGHIGRVAVLEACRNKGFGAHILQALIDEAKKRAYRRVFLGSQVSVIGFYTKMGFKICGDEFIEAGIRHIEMEIII